MKKLALAIAFAFAFGVLSLAYGHYRYKKTVPSETPCDSCSPSKNFLDVGIIQDRRLWTESPFLKQADPCRSCSVSGDVHGVGGQSCSISCPKGYIPKCLPAEFGVRPVPKCECRRE
jgi:hypothetical protein